MRASLVAALLLVAGLAAGGCGGDDDTTAATTEATGGVERPARADFPRPSGRSMRVLIGKLPQGPELAPSVALLEPGRNRFGFALFDRGNRQIGGLEVAL
jgi:hypothetical protein